MRLFDKGGKSSSRGFAKSRSDSGASSNRARKTHSRTAVESLEPRTLLTVTNISINSIVPTEGTPFGTAAAPAQIATFTVNNYIGTDESSEYSAQIKWGDGTESAGLGPVTISFLANLGNGSAEYAVNSYHTYAEATTTANPYSLSVTIDDNTGPGTIQSQSGPVHVNDAPLTQLAVPTSTSATVGGALTNVTVGEFTDANPLANASDFSVQVSWGDGQTSAGTVVPYLTSSQAGGVAFAVEGSHTYTTAGSYTISAAVHDNETSSVTLASPVTVAGAALVPSAAPIVVTEGVTIPAGTPVGTFTDMNGPQPVANYSSSFVLFPGATASTPLNFTQNGSSNSFTLTTAAPTNFTAGGIDEGLYGYTLTVSDTHGDSATTTGALTVKDAPLTPVSAPVVAATEGTPLTGQQVFVFSDANGAATIGDFTATINWGDGSAPSVGTVTSLGGGQFSVAGSHTYASAIGSPFTITTTVNDVGGSKTSGQATANVAPAALTTPTGVPVYGTEGQSLIGVPVGTFVSDNPLASASGFTATITWGNGNTTPGVVTRVGGTATTSEFEVTGSNTYLTVAGSPFAITTTVTNNAGGAPLSIPTTATITQTPIVVSVFPLSAHAGTATPAGQLVGTFTDNGGSDPLADYSVTVNWGDGSSDTIGSGVVITPQGANTFNITAPTHTYAKPGFYVMTVSVNDSDPATGTGAGPVVVAPATLTASGATAGGPITTVEGQPLTNVLVATFTSSDLTSAPTDFTATIDWGDGKTTAGTITQPGGPGTTFDVNGSHIYTTDGTYTISVTIAGLGGQATVTSTASITEAPITVGPALAISGYENTPLSNVDVATFTSPDIYETAASFVATISWGDGTPATAGTIIQDAAGSFHVEGNHTYTTAGSFLPTVTIAEQDNPGAVMGTADPTVTIASTPLLVTGVPINGTEGIALPNAQNAANGTVVATFTDAVQSDPLSDYTATIDWGNGQVTPGTIIPTGGPNYEVVAPTAPAITYADEGNYTVKVSITDHDSNSGPGFFQAFGVSTATIVDAPLTAVTNPAITGTEGTPLTGQQVFVFSDANLTALATDFAATINWGDGTTPSVGTVTSLGGGQFSVTGSHTYASANGSPFTVTTSVLDDGGSKVTGQTTATISPASLSLGTGVPVYGTEGQNLVGVPVATFVSNNPVATAASFTASINWGNGNTSPGVITRVGGTATTSEFEITGSNTYLSDAGSPFPITVTVSNNSGGASLSIPTTATITQTPIQVSIFPLSAKAGSPTPANQLIGTFTDTGGSDPLGDYSVTVNWGDGTSDTIASGVAITPVGANTFNITAPTHTYAKPGFYVLVVSVHDSDPATGTGAGPVVVSPPTVTASGVTPGSITTVEGTPLTNILVATFTSSDLSAAPSDFTATINWGDGVTSLGTITQPGGPGTTFDVTGSHTYKFDGVYTITTTIIGEGTQATAVSTATITEAPITVGPPVVISGYENTPLISVDTATFTSTDPFETASTFVATINWGDGSAPTAGTIVQDAGGTFHVQGNHTYLSAGKFFTTITIAEQDSPTTVMGTANGTVTIAATPLLVTGVNVNATEGIALPNAQNVTNGTVVATFTDSVQGDPLSDYTASIDWGNGTVTPGTIIPTGGPNFEVIAPSTPTVTYAEEGSFTVKVTVTDSDSNSAPGFFQAFGFSTATVKDAPLTADPTQPVVTAFQQTPLTAVQVSKFTDGNPTAPLSDFTATIDWGDGSPASAGQIIQPGGVGTAFYVIGNHTYANPTTPPASPYVVTVSIKDVGGSSLTTTTTANVTASLITGTPVTVSGTEGQALANVVVAYFSDSGTPGPLSSYSANINWGTGLPGSVTIGAIVPLGGNEFAVEGSYTYPEESPAGLPYSITVTIDHNGVPATTVISHAQIADAPITGTAVPVFATEGQAFTGTVGVFMDTNPNGKASDFTATISWGNGDSTSGTIVANGTSFLVTAADPVSGKGYAYPEEGSYPFSITVKDVGGSEFTAFQTATVADAALTATGLTLGVSPTISEYPPFSGQVASFTDADPNGKLSDYTATINWGDGTVTPATISLSTSTQGLFIVNGTHQYAQSTQPYLATITVKDVGGATATANTSITISDAPLTAGSPASVSAIEGHAFTTQVGTFTDANPFAAPSQYSATINWGDGVTSSGVIGKQSNGTFTVTGSHTYLEESPTGTPYAITVVIQDIGGTNPSSVTDTATATVGDAPLTSQGSPINGVEGVGLSPSPITVATFTDADPNGTPTDYTATIQWGDGSSSTGTIVATGSSPNGTTFSVTGTHTYADEGTYQTRITITDAGGSQTVATGNAVIADAQLVPAATHPAVNATEGVSFTTPVALFVDNNPGAAASDFTATIDWGDGTPRSTGTITAVGVFPLPGGGSVSVWSVTGSHNYIDPSVNNGTGHFPIVVNVLDKGGSSVVVTNTANMTPTPITLTAQLNPASDTGESNMDGVTKDNTPNFIGTTEPFATVKLYAAPLYTSNWVQIGSGEANAAGQWSITTSVLADGKYSVWANAVDRSGIGFVQTQVLPNAAQPSLVIDTVGPTVDSLSFDRAIGTIYVTFGDTLSGLDLASITDANNYSLTRPKTPLGTFLVTGISTPVPGPNPGEESVALTINNGRTIKGGFNFNFVIHSESPSYPNGVQDVAGNAMSGTFYGTFPSGNGVPGGDFVARLVAFHNQVLPPMTRVGTVHPQQAIPAVSNTSVAHNAIATNQAHPSTAATPHSVHDLALTAITLKKKHHHGR